MNFYYNRECLEMTIYSGIAYLAEINVTGLPLWNETGVVKFVTRG